VKVQTIFNIPNNGAKLVVEKRIARESEGLGRGAERFGFVANFPYLVPDPRMADLDALIEYQASLGDVVP
jgi:hypothetical protein